VAAPQPHRAAFQAVVTGRVQGVGYRYTAVRQARALGITGTVANRADGGVDVRAEGARPDLERFCEWLRHGPPGAHVRDVQVEWTTASGRFDDFEVQF
jgi:acylphosphatase